MTSSAGKRRENTGEQPTPILSQQGSPAGNHQQPSNAASSLVTTSTEAVDALRQQVAELTILVKSLALSTPQQAATNENLLISVPENQAIGSEEKFTDASAHLPLDIYQPAISPTVAYAAAFQDLTREESTLFKYAQDMVHVFNGGTDLLLFQDFVDEIDRAKITFQLTDARTLALATHKLKGPANIWLRALEREIAAGRTPPFTSWPMLRSLLYKEYVPASHQNNVKDKLYLLKATSSLREYVDAFRTLMNQLLNPMPVDMIHAFLRGLPDHISDLLRQNDQAMSNISFCFEVALRYDKGASSTSLYVLQTG
jgi:Retrotransposon gag protein